MKHPDRPGAGGPGDTGAAETTRFPIAVKLIAIISAIVILSLGTITALVTVFVSGDVRVTAEENNLTVNARSAAAAENEISTTRSNAFLLLDLLSAAGNSGALSRQASAFFFERNPQVAAILVSDAGGKARPTTLVNNRFFASKELDPSLVDKFRADEAEAIRLAEGGEVMALNLAPAFEEPVIALLYPWREYGYDQAAAVLFSTETLSEAFGSGALNASFMVNHRGDLLAHGDAELVLAGASLAEHPLVRAMRENGDSDRQVPFTAADPGAGAKRRYFGAYRQLSMGNIAVLTTIEQKAVFEGVNGTTVRNLWLTLAVLFASGLFIWIFSRTLSSPVRALAAASEEIERGNFAIELRSRSRDEIGLLTRRFTRMARGLAERERLKDSFGRFTNKEIAEKAMRGELGLGGEDKAVTVFFSDIRSFTSISESMTPSAVVEFLNDYMTRMVACVNATGGVVDKFIGDAVMAVWGAPVSAGSPRDDALNCLRAALMMRASLAEFNAGRGGPGKPVIRIGCGINSGHVVAGQIGSHERMEYTVIGDAVNLASRTESLNKPLCTDILITEDTWNLVKDEVSTEEMPPVSVKGKEAPVRLFAVVNMPRAEGVPGAGPGGPESLAKVRSLLGLAAPDASKVDLDGEEKKYKILG